MRLCSGAIEETRLAPFFMFILKNTNFPRRTQININ